MYDNKTRIKPIGEHPAYPLIVGAEIYPGLTARAVMAMHMAAAMISGASAYSAPSEVAAEVAADAVAMADALILELQKTDGRKLQ